MKSVVPRVPPTSMGYFSPSMLCSEPGLFCGSPGTPQCKWNSTALYFLFRPPPPTLGDALSATLTGEKNQKLFQRRRADPTLTVCESRDVPEIQIYLQVLTWLFQIVCSRNSALQKLNSYKTIAEFNLRLIITTMTSGVRASYTSQKTLYALIFFSKKLLYQSKFDPSLFGF